MRQVAFWLGVLLFILACVKCPRAEPPREVNAWGFEGPTGTAEPKAQPSPARPEAQPSLGHQLTLTSPTPASPSAPICRKGKPCGNTCISIDKTCHK
ncbi:hypothetical protein NAEX_09048 [Nannocystis exedens]|nr:hypothetical protein NAEX_09048 [Nannocystis exedens]